MKVVSQTRKLVNNTKWRRLDDIITTFVRVANCLYISGVSWTLFGNLLYRETGIYCCALDVHITGKKKARKF